MNYGDIRARVDAMHTDAVRALVTDMMHHIDNTGRDECDRHMSAFVTPIHLGDVRTCTECGVGMADDRGLYCGQCIDAIQQRQEARRANDR